MLPPALFMKLFLIHFNKYIIVTISIGELLYYLSQNGIASSNKFKVTQMLTTCHQKL